MKWSMISLVVLGLLAAVAAAVLVAGLRRPPAPTVVEMTEDQKTVVVAGADLPSMTVVRAEDLATEKVPATEVNKDSYRHPSEVIGRVLAIPVMKGQALTKECFATQGSGQQLAAAIPQGKRAVTLALDGSSSLGAVIYPGSVVDILVSFHDPEDKQQAVSATLLRRVQVFAVGSKTVFKETDDNEAIGSSGGQPRSLRMITVLVNPEQAQALHLAMQNGSVSLALRNPLDTQSDMARPTYLTELAQARRRQNVAASLQRYLVKQPAADASSPEGEATPLVPRGNDPWQTTIIRGDTSETRSFPEEQAENQSSLSEL